jgi:hypothetical protein
MNLRKSQAELPNADPRTVSGFGNEWSVFDQSGLPKAERDDLFASYFSLFPWDLLPESSEGFDMGCGSGRWAASAAPRVGISNRLAMFCFTMQAWDHGALRKEAWILAIRWGSCITFRILREQSHHARQNSNLAHLYCSIFITVLTMANLGILCSHGGCQTYCARRSAG